MKRLLAIQTELKCNKSQFNSFGKYNYRSCEDILESLKPLLKKNKVCLTLSDDLVLHENGDAYICAVATLFDAETNEQIAQTKAYAMVDKTHKGMSADQQFGCASSYSRKYCLAQCFYWMIRRMPTQMNITLKLKVKQHPRRLRISS